MLLIYGSMPLQTLVTRSCQISVCSVPVVIVFQCVANMKCFIIERNITIGLKTGDKNTAIQNKHLFISIILLVHISYCLLLYYSLL